MILLFSFLQTAVALSSLKRDESMTNVASFEGLLSVCLIFICACTFLRRVKALRGITNEWQKLGPLSILHKASVVGFRLKIPVALACTVLAGYILFHK